MFQKNIPNWTLDGILVAKTCYLYQVSIVDVSTLIVEWYAQGNDIEHDTLD